MDTTKPARWFRMYAEFSTDPKVQMLSEVDQRRYVMLLCLRCSNGDVTLQEHEVAFQLRCSNEEWLKTRGVLIEKNLITEDSKPTSWDKRQYASDSSTERVSKHRDKVKRYSNGGVTPPETEKEKETETKKEKTLSANADDFAIHDDDKKLLFDYGREILLRHDVPEKTVGGLIGKMLKAVEVDEAMSILGGLAQKKKGEANPVGYITNAIMGKGTSVYKELRKQYGSVICLPTGGYNCGGRIFNADGSGGLCM